jgi:hypothetical protein
MAFRIQLGCKGVKYPQSHTLASTPGCDFINTLA